MKGGIHSMKKAICLTLMLLLAAYPLFACAEHASFDFPGNVIQMAFSDGKLYVQTKASYPESVVYLVDSENADTPVQICDGLDSERDVLFAAGGHLYKHQSGESNITLIRQNDTADAVTSMSLKPSALSEVNPFLVSLYEDGALVYILSQGESLHLCRLDVATGEIKSINMNEDLFAVQPYAEGKNLVVLNHGAYEVYEINWDTLEQTLLGALPNGATSIAYSREQDVIYYMADKALWRYQWDGSSTQVMTDLPHWTDQRAFMLDATHFVTLSSDLAETLILIDLAE